MCEEIDRRFGEDPDPALRREVARALLYKGDALVEYDQPDEAAAAMDTIVALYGEDADPGLIEVTAHTRSHIALLGQIDAGSADHPPA